MRIEFITVNPALPHEEKTNLLWIRHMKKSGWIFTDQSEEKPKEYETVVFATGDKEEFLTNLGYYVSSGYITADGTRWEAGSWQSQTYPVGRVLVREPVIAWFRLPTPETFNEFHAVIGNDFLSRMFAVKELSM